METCPPVIGPGISISRALTIYVKDLGFDSRDRKFYFTQLGKFRSYFALKKLILNVYSKLFFYILNFRLIFVLPAWHKISL